MNLSTMFHCLTLSFTIALTAGGCGEAAPIPTERSEQAAPTRTSTPLADVSDPTALGEEGFESLRERRGDFVAELLALRPLMGRDHAPRFTQPAWAEGDAAWVIFHILRDPSAPEGERAALAQRLRTNESAWSGAAIALLQREDSESVRAALMASLAHAEAPAMAQASVLGLADPSPMVRDWATFGASRVLANHADAPGIATLIDALVARIGDQDDQVRAGIFRALGLAGDPNLLDHLANGLRDPNARVRLRALAAIQSTAPSKALAFAQSAGLATDEDPSVVRAFKRLEGK